MAQERTDPRFLGFAVMSCAPALRHIRIRAYLGAMTALDNVSAQIQISPSVSIPQLGFGTFQIPPQNTQQAVESALELGYRHIDTACAYYNEAEVGAAIRASALPRDEIFVTTKLRNADQGRDEAKRAFDASYKALGLDKIDLYLIHWPLPSKNLYVDSWKVLLELRDQGVIRAAGVSNFLPEHLERIITETGQTPAVNQLEVHPRFSQPDVLAVCRQHGITVESYSPLGQGADLTDPVITGIAGKVGATPAQVVIAWHLNEGRIVIPKSVHAERMKENLAAASIQLSPEDLQTIDALNSPEGRIGGDPATFAFSQAREDEARRNNGLNE